MISSPLLLSLAVPLSLKDAACTVPGSLELESSTPALPSSLAKLDSKLLVSSSSSSLPPSSLLLELADGAVVVLGLEVLEVVELVEDSVSVDGELVIDVRLAAWVAETIATTRTSSRASIRDRLRFIAAIVDAIATAMRKMLHCETDAMIGDREKLGLGLNFGMGKLFCHEWAEPRATCPITSSANTNTKTQ